MTPRKLPLIISALALTLALAGCGFGLTVSLLGKAMRNKPPKPINQIPWVHIDRRYENAKISGKVDVFFQVYDEENNAVTASVEYFHDNAWHSCSQDAADRETPDGTLDSKPGGVSHYFIWNTSTDFPYTTADVMLRITPTEIQSGLAGELDSFGLTVYNNTAPEATIVAECLNSSTLSGNVLIEYTLLDAGGDNAAVTIEYSVGGPFLPCSEYTGVGSVSEGLENLSTGVLSPESHFFVWNSLADMGESYRSGIQIKITPRDFSMQGTAAVSQYFTVNNNTPPSAAIMTFNPAYHGTITVQFGLFDNASDPLDVALLFSTDNWATSNVPRALSGYPADLTGLASSPSGASHYFYWDTTRDFPDLDVPGVQMRIQVADPYSAGENATSNAFAVNNLTITNTPPQASLASPSGVQTGNVSFVYLLFDADNNVVSIEASYSTDCGSTWFPSTAVPGGECSSGLEANPSGVQHVFQWDSKTDLPGAYFTSVRFRIIPSDTETGFPATSNIFILNNNSPPLATVFTPSSPAAGLVNVSYTLTDADAECSSISAAYSVDNGSTWKTATFAPPTSTTDLFAAPFGTPHFFIWDSLADIGEDIKNAALIRIIPTDKTGIPGTGGQSNSFIVNNNTPPVAVITSPSGDNSAEIDINYTLSDSMSHYANIAVEYKDVAGIWHNATETITPRSNGTVNLTTSPSGVSHRFVWNSISDIGAIDCSGIVLRIRPSDTMAGLDSNTITINVKNKSLANTPPAALVYTPNGEQSGDVPVIYKLQDMQNDSATIIAEYSTDGGATWNIATESTSGISEGNSGLATSPVWTTHVWVWDSAKNAKDVNTTTAKIRITPSDLRTGASDSTASFALYNNTPPAVSFTSIPNPASENVSVIYKIFDVNSDLVNVSVMYSPDGGLHYYSATAAGGDGKIDLAASPAGTPHTFVWNSLADAGYATLSSVRIRITPSDRGTGTAASSENFVLANNQPPVITVESPQGTLTGNITVRYTLYDSNSDRATLGVFYSTDAGASFMNCASISGALANLTTSPVGINGSFTWSTLGDIGVKYAPDVRIKITPRDIDTGSPVTTSQFSVNNNTLPSISGITVSGNSDLVTVTYTLSDSSNDNCTIFPSFLIYGTSTYTNASAGSGGDGITNLSSSPTGVSHAFVWNTSLDLPYECTNITFRLIPYDTETGLGNTSESFRIDNDGPPTVIAYTPPQNSSNYIYVNYRVFDNGSDPAGIAAQYSTDNGGTWKTAAAAVSNPDHENTASVGTSPAGILHMFVWNSFADTGQNNTTVTLRFTATDLNSTWKTGTGSTSPFDVQNAGVGGNMPPSASIQPLSSPVQGDITVVYSLRDYNTGDTANVSVTYSTNGTDWYPATEKTGPPSEGRTLLATSIDGKQHIFIWKSRADFGDSDRANVRLAITPTDSAGATGNTAVTAPFSVANNNPPVLAAATPSSPAWGNISVIYLLYDSSSDNVNLNVEFSYDGGATFFNAAMAGGDGTANLSSSPNGVLHTFIWDTQNANYASVFLRFTPSDYSMTGTSGQTGMFSVTNVTASKMLVLLPGQTFTPGTGVTGTPSDRPVGVPFESTVLAVSINDYIDYSFNGAITFQSSDAHAPVPLGPALFSSGSASFYTIMHTAGNSHFLSAFCPILPSANSDTFTVTAGNAAHILILLPGEGLLQGAAEKTGAPAAQAANADLTSAMTACIVDVFYNVIPNASANAGIASSDPLAYIGDSNGAAPGVLSIANGSATYGASGGFRFGSAGSRTVTISDCAGLIPGETSTVILVTGELVWTGASDNNWNNPANWSPAVVPDSATAVRIPFAANLPVLGSNVSIASLSIEASASLTLSGYSLTITGNMSVAASSTLDGRGSTLTLGGAWTGSGSYIRDNSSVVVFAGPASQTIPSGIRFTNVVVSNPSNATYAEIAVNLDCSITISAGCALVSATGCLANGNVIILGMLDGRGVKITVPGLWTLSGSYLYDNLSILELTGSIPKTLSGGPYGAITVESGAQAALGEDVSINGPLTISSGTFDLAGRTLSISGTFTDSGTFKTSGGSLVFSGAGSFNITGSPVLENIGTLSVSGPNVIACRPLDITNFNITSGEFVAGAFQHNASTLSVSGGTLKLDSPAAEIAAQNIAFAGGNALISSGALTFTNSFTASAGAFNPAAGTVEYSGVSGGISMDNSSAFADLYIAADGLVLNSDIRVSGTLTIPAGVSLNVSGKTLRVDTEFAISGSVSSTGGTLSAEVLSIEQGGILSISGSILKIGASADIEGDFAATASAVTAADNASRYAFTVHETANLNLSGLDFSYADNSGFNISGIPTFTSMDSIAFTNAQPGGRHLTITGDAEFTDTWDSFSFDSSFGNGNNIWADGSGWNLVLLFTNHSGAGTGENYDHEEAGALILFSGPPSASVSPISGEHTGDVTVSYALYDPDNSTCGVFIEYSTDGVNYQPCAESNAPGTEGKSGLHASPLGANHTFIWNTDTDFAGTEASGVRIRITPYDSENGSSAETDQFAIDNNRPPAAAVQNDLVIRQAEFLNSPGKRSGYSIVYDEWNARFVLFGGTSNNGATCYSDVWRFDDNGWNILAPAGAPPSARHGQAAVYDLPHRRMVVFGGEDVGTLKKDVWALDFSSSANGQWMALSPAGIEPAARRNAAAVLDAPMNRMILFGGNGSSLLADTWALDLSTGNGSWTSLSPSGSAPSARCGHAAAFDPYRRRMLVYGGYDGSFAGGLYALDFSGSTDGVWAALTPSGGTPGAKFGAAAVFDPVSSRFMLFGGTTDGNSGSDAAWSAEFSDNSGCAWSAFTGAFTLNRGAFDVSAAYDSRRGEFLAHGGIHEQGHLNNCTFIGMLASAGWGVLNELSPTGTPPTAAQGYRMIYDEPNRRTIAITPGSGEVYELKRSAAIQGVWKRLYPSGISPGLQNFEMIYDRSHSRAITFDKLGSVGMLDLSDGGNGSWTVYTYPIGSPVGRTGFSAAYDPAHGRMLIFGGNESGTLKNDIWAYDLSSTGEGSWLALSPSGIPPASRSGAAIAFDTGGKRAVIFGGRTGASAVGDLWEIDFASDANGAWAQIAATGGPQPRSGSTAVLIEPDARFVLFGGLDNSLSPVSEAWAVTLASATTEWSALGTTGIIPISGHAAAYDRERNDILIFGGWNGAKNLNNLFAFEAGGTIRDQRSGDVVIDYILHDLESDNVNVSIGYSIDGGFNWTAASEGAGSEGFAGLSSSPNGEQHRFVWASGTDLAGQEVSDVRIRILASDAGDNGSAAASAGFRVDNLAPAIMTVSQNLAADPTGRAIDVEFSENVSRYYAENAAAYSVTGGRTVLSATLQSDGKTVRLVFDVPPYPGEHTLSASGARDGAGNGMSPVSGAAISGSDIFAPVAAITSPANNSIITGSTISYTIDEDCLNGSIVWTRTSGESDPASPHTVTLGGGDLSSGLHEGVPASGAPTLVPGAVYTVTAAFHDVYGNGPGVSSAVNLAFHNASSIQWMLADTECLKALVNSSRIQRVNYSDFDCAGLTTSFNPRYLQCYYEGREIPIYVFGEEDNIFDAGDYILFYGEAYEDEYTRYNAYYFIVGDAPGLRMNSGDVTPSGTPSGDGSYWTTRHFETNYTFIADLVNCGDVDRWMYTTASSCLGGTSANTSYTVSLDMAAPLSDNALFSYYLQGYSTGNVHNYRLFYNGFLVGSGTFDYRNNTEVLDAALPGSNLLNGSNTIKIELTCPLNDIIYPNWFELSYRRLYDANNSAEIIFNCETDGDHTISGFNSSDIEILDITNPDDPIRLAGFTSADNSISFNGAGSRDYIACGVSYAARPLTRKNVPSTLHDASMSADYIIITHENLTCSSETLKAWRESKGMTVVIADVEDVYDEFNWGRKSASAIRAFLERAYTTWAQPPPEFVLLMGDASWDPKGFRGTTTDFVPTIFVETSYQYSASDMMLADVAGCDCLAEFRIGRIPADNSAEADAVVSKIISYENASFTGTWEKQVLLICDVQTPANTTQFETESEALRPRIPVDFTIDNAYRTVLTVGATTAAMNLSISEGALIANYIGHALTNSLGSTAFWTNTSPQGLKNSGKYCFFISASCSSGAFQNHIQRSNMEVMLVVSGKGAVGIWGSTGLNLLGTQTAIDDEFLYQTFTGNNRVVGRAAALALEYLASLGVDDVVRDTIRTYAILGDPALELKLEE
jgi:hypothetical protein